MDMKQESTLMAGRVRPVLGFLTTSRPSLAQVVEIGRDRIGPAPEVEVVRKIESILLTRNSCVCVSEYTRQAPNHSLLSARHYFNAIKHTNRFHLVSRGLGSPAHPDSAVRDTPRRVGDTELETL